MRPTLMQRENFQFEYPWYADIGMTIYPSDTNQILQITFNEPQNEII
jgi:hypothetical protein